MTLRTVLIVLAVIAVLPVILLVLLSALSRAPANLGANAGRLAPCPDSPNCVCSQGADAAHAIEPLKFAGSPGAAWEALEAAVESTPRMKIVERSDGYLRAESTSRLFRFVDDVEFLLDAAAGVIHVRSASRAGRSDFGVNRARIEDLRARMRPVEAG